METVNRDTLLRLVAEYEPAMLAAERYIWTHPQTGYKEWDAHRYLADTFRAMGFTLREAGDIPGFVFDIETGRPGPTLCILGELDSVLCADHPESDPVTGAVHACGHNCQTAALIGIAGVLRNPGILSHLAGRVRIMAVPAEELLELEERIAMRESGRIRYLGGKTEFMHRGFFDGVDMTLMIHAGGGDAPSMYMIGGANAAIAKTVRFKGRSAHAAAFPWRGVNALYAAQTAMNAINALRETFPDDDHVRVHPIITNGGRMVNAVPAEACLELQVRASTFAVARQFNAVVNRALTAGALALGAQVEIRDLDVYMPNIHNRGLNDVMYQVGCSLYGAEAVHYDPNKWDFGSTDMGNLSSVMPSNSLFVSGTCGTGHGDDYYVTSPHLAVVHPAEILVSTACALLENDAARARQIIADFKPLFGSIREFLDAVDGVCTDKHPLAYTGEHAAHADWD